MASENESPERIWLNNPNTPANEWMQRSVYRTSQKFTDDIEYIRADLVAAAIATERERLQKIRQIADLGSARELDDAMDRLEAIVEIAG